MGSPKLEVVGHIFSHDIFVLAQIEGRFNIELGVVFIPLSFFSSRSIRTFASLLMMTKGNVLCSVFLYHNKIKLLLPSPMHALDYTGTSNVRRLSMSRPPPSLDSSSFINIYYPYCHSFVGTYVIEPLPFYFLSGHCRYR